MSLSNWSPDPGDVLTETWLRAIEWISWPLFISQSIVPVLLYWYDWTWIVAVVSVGTLLWRVTVLQWFVSYPLATFGAYFVRLKWVVCPLMVGNGAQI